jgi:hypothetical protein
MTFILVREIGTLCSPARRTQFDVGIQIDSGQSDHALERMEALEARRADTGWRQCRNRCSLQSIVELWLQSQAYYFRYWDQRGASKNPDAPEIRAERIRNALELGKELDREYAQRHVASK